MRDDWVKEDELCDESQGKDKRLLGDEIRGKDGWLKGDCCWVEY